MENELYRDRVINGKGKNIKKLMTKGETVK